MVREDGNTSSPCQMVGGASLGSLLKQSYTYLAVNEFLQKKNYVEKREISSLLH